MKVPKTLFFMVQNPIPLIVHLTWWFFFAALGVVFDDPFVEVTWPHVAQIVSPPLSIGDLTKAASIVFDEIIKDLMRDGVFLFIIALFPFIISYREAKGNLTGIAKEQRAWIGWYRHQQETIATEDTLEAPSTPLESRKINSYFRKALKTLLSMARNPVRFIVHFACWFSAFTLLFVVTDWAGIVDTTRKFVKILPDFAMPPLVLAFLSSYQEARGTVKGTAKVRQAWTEWSHKQQEAKTQETRFDVPPPLFDTAG